MSHPASENPEIEELRLRVNNLCHVVGNRLKGMERKRKGYLAGGAVLAAACVISFSTITFMAFKLDAHAITQIGRLELERQLPGSRESLKDYLQSEAPAVTNALIRELLAALPLLRPLLMREIDSNLKEIAKRFEEGLLEEMRLSIAASSAEIERQFPDATDTERVTLVVQAVAAQFDESVKLVLHKLYPEYQAEMERVYSFLVTLEETEENQLTDRERKQKELIQTVLRLVIREQAASPEQF